MPNHCSNKLIVNGKKEDLIAFAEKYCYKPVISKKYNGVDFNKVIECPKGSESIHEIDFCTKNWGTKWCAYDCRARYSEGENGGELCFYYQTAWAPAEGIVKKLTEDNPHLEITCYFAESGNCFAGYIYKNSGDITSIASEVESYYEQHLHYDEIDFMGDDDED